MSRAHTAVLAVGLGCGQLVAWGVLFYSIAVLAEPMRRELELTPAQVFGCFTGSLLIAALAAPMAGRLVDRLGGRTTLAASALAGAASFAMLARAGALRDLALAWAAAGIAMALGLYDPCFAAVGQVAKDSFRKVVTIVTLIGGFASTVCWPLTALLLRLHGWRGTCELYAIALAACAVLYLGVLPGPARSRVPRSVAPAVRAASWTPSARRQARLLAWAFAGAACVGGSMSAHIIEILLGLNVTAERALWIASSIGVLQTVGRVVDLAVNARRSPIDVGLFTFGALALAMALLAGAGPFPALVYGSIALYGLANGLVTIAKATIPTELWGFEKVGERLGTFSGPSLAARAVAPLAFALLRAEGLFIALLALATMASASLLTYLYALRHRR